MKRLLILGAGGFGRTVGEAAKLTGDWEEIAMLDDNFPQVSLSGHFEVVGRSQDLKRIAADYDSAVCAIGNGKIRKKLTESILETGLSLATIIHPRAYVSVDAIVGAGTSIMAGAVVGPYAKVGQGCILNANATADHDSIMEDYAHLSVGVAIAGSATLREGAWLQAGRSAGYGVDVPAWAVWN